LQNGHGADNNLGVTLASVSNLETPASWVRLIFVNDKDAPWPVDGAAVAPTTEIGDGVQPVGDDGKVDAALWTQVTFNSHGLDGDPGKQPGSVTRLAVPPDANPRLAQPVLAFSDWMAVPPLRRRDGGFGALLLLRTYSGDRIRYVVSAGAPDPAIGRVHLGFWSGGSDGARPPWSYEPHRMDNLFATFGLQYVATVPGATLVGIGDSIMGSARSRSSISGFGLRAAAMVSSPAVPVSYVNEGVSGRQSVDYLADGLADLRALKPQAALIQTWSENDALTGEAADASLAGALALAAEAKRRNCVPILVTAAPVFQTRPQFEGFRQRSVGQVRQLGQQGWYVLDLDRIWGTGSTPNTYQAAFDSGDHTHPNDAGCATAGRVLAEILRKVLQLS
jgi:lysophospholipase L1-like esterase